MVWVPLANQYIINSVAFYGKRTKAIVYTLIVNVVSLFAIIVQSFSFFGVDGDAVIKLQGCASLFNIVAFILILRAQYSVYSVISKKSKLLIVLNVFFGMNLAPVFMFFLRNKKFIDEWYSEVSKKSQQNVA